MASKTRFLRNKFNFKVLSIIIILISLPLTILFFTRGSTNTRNYASVTASQVDSLVPEKSNYIDALKLGTPKREDRIGSSSTDVYFKSTIADLEDKVAIRNNKVSYTLKNTYYKKVSVPFGTSVTLFDPVDEVIVWEVYPESGLALGTVEGYVYKEIHFMPNKNISKEQLAQDLSLRLDQAVEDLEVNVEDPNTISGSSVKSATTTTTAANCPSAATILSTFGAKIVGASTCRMREVIYNSYSTAFYWSQYKQLIKKGTTFNLQLFTEKLGDGKCRGYVPGPNYINLYDLADCAPDDYKSLYIIIHETGHLMTFRNYKALYQDYPNNTYVSLDPSCYNLKFLKTYSLRTTDPKLESMAEASALFLLNSKVGRLGTIASFNTECNHTFVGIQNKVFGPPPPGATCIRGRICPI